MKAWLFQDHRQKQRLGAKAPWSVGWIDPDGKRKSKRIGAKSLAAKFARKIEGQLAAGTYETASNKSWADFRAEFERRIADGMRASTRRHALSALDRFAEIVKPKLVRAITTRTIDDFIARRRQGRGQKKGSAISPATINKDLRHLKAALRVAHDWGHLPKVPKVRMLKEPKKLIRYVTPEDFASIYEHCDDARKPAGLPYSAGDWWRAYLVFLYMTGWRCNEPLSLRRDAVDLDKRVAYLRAADSKGNRDESVPLHPVVVEHLRTIASFKPLLFPWPHTDRDLYDDYHRIQKAAGVHLPCRGDHEHTETCHLYGFHDLRRAFATNKAPRLTADALQALMRHKSYQTTQRYIGMAEQLDEAVETLHVPKLPPRAEGGI